MLYSASITSGIIIGGIAALTAAALWAGGTFIYGRVGTDVPPMELNLVKCILAILLMVITSLFMGEKVPQATALPYILLVCSGIIGIGLGDTAYFESLNRLGAKLALLLTVLAPPIAGSSPGFSWVKRSTHLLVGDHYHSGRSGMGDMGRTKRQSVFSKRDVDRDWVWRAGMPDSGHWRNILTVCPDRIDHFCVTNCHHPVDGRTDLTYSIDLIF